MESRYLDFFPFLLHITKWLQKSSFTDIFIISSTLNKALFRISRTLNHWTIPSVPIYYSFALWHLFSVIILRIFFSLIQSSISELHVTGGKLYHNFNQTTMRKLSLSHSIHWATQIIKNIIFLPFLFIILIIIQHSSPLMF